MITNIIEFINEASDVRIYRGYEIIKNKDKTPGEYGLWSVPELYYRDFANKIVKDFQTVSITQGREAIDEWFDFNLKVKKYKTTN